MVSALLIAMQSAIESSKMAKETGADLLSPHANEILLLIARVFGMARLHWYHQCVVKGDFATPKIYFLSPK